MMFKKQNMTKQQHILQILIDFWGLALICAIIFTQCTSKFLKRSFLLNIAQYPLVSLFFSFLFASQRMTWFTIIQKRKVRCDKSIYELIWHIFAKVNTYLQKISCDNIDAHFGIIVTRLRGLLLFYVCIISSCVSELSFTESTKTTASKWFLFVNYDCILNHFVDNATFILKSWRTMGITTDGAQVLS